MATISVGGAGRDPTGDPAGFAVGLTGPQPAVHFGVSARPSASPAAQSTRQPTGPAVTTRRSYRPPPLGSLRSAHDSTTRDVHTGYPARTSRALSLLRLGDQLPDQPRDIRPHRRRPRRHN